MLDFGVTDSGAVADGCEWSDVAVFEQAVFANHRRTTHGAVLQDAAFADMHAS